MALDEMKKQEAILFEKENKEYSGETKLKDE